MAVVEQVEVATSERRRLALGNPATREPLGEIESRYGHEAHQSALQTLGHSGSFRETVRDLADHLGTEHNPALGQDTGRFLQRPEHRRQQTHF